jgi:mono/diheme cytochrome c family protein
MTGRAVLRPFFSLCLLATVTVGPGCATGAAPEPAKVETAATPMTFDEQVGLGGKAYGQYCAGCHGNAGQGTDQAPAVVGAGALPKDPPATRKARKGQFRTAMDIAQFVVANMPPAPRAKPSESEYWAILAFDLFANGVKSTQAVTPANAATIVIHP